MSSGATYGSSFDTPVDEQTKSVIAINNLQPQNWYAIAKLHAECWHRALAHLPIIDFRIFSYYSHTQDIEARFFITDILREIRDRMVFRTSSDYIVRDYIHSTDFYQLVKCVMVAPALNMVIDCYSRKPIDKFKLLNLIKDNFSFEYEIENKIIIIQKKKL